MEKIYTNSGKNIQVEKLQIVEEIVGKKRYLKNRYSGNKNRYSKKKRIVDKIHSGKEN